MIDVQDSITRLSTTVTAHFNYIQSGKDFAREWAIQFELAYTDFRTIQMALQLDSTLHPDIVGELTTAYNAVYEFEYPFATGGLAVFDQQCQGRMADYEVAVNRMQDVLTEIAQLA